MRVESVPADPEGRAWSGTAQAVRGQEVLVELCAGTAGGPAGDRPCAPTTRYQAGSISKLVLSAVVLALVERHVLDLERPVGRWLAPAVWAPVTLHQLLGQTSGMGHWGDVPGLGATLLTTPPPRDELVALIADAPLVHAPGERWRYSGPGFLLAALVVEAATGAAYGDVAAELVLGPADLRSTTSGAFPLGASDVAAGHHRGEPVAVHAGFTQIPGTGDLWTTVGDLVRLDQALRTGRVLHPETAAQLWEPHARIVPTDPPDAGRVSTDAYGYGTFLGTVGGHRAQINPGDNPGYQSLLVHLPDLGVDLAVLSNDDGSGVTVALDRLLEGVVS